MTASETAHQKVVSLQQDLEKYKQDARHYQHVHESDSEEGPQNDSQVVSHKGKGWPPTLPTQVVSEATGPSTSVGPICFSISSQGVPSGKVVYQHGPQSVGPSQEGVAAPSASPSQPVGTQDAFFQSFPHLDGSVSISPDFKMQLDSSMAQISHFAQKMTSDYCESMRAFHVQLEDRMVQSQSLFQREMQLMQDNFYRTMCCQIGVHLPQEAFADSLPASQWPPAARSDWDEDSQVPMQPEATVSEPSRVPQETNLDGSKRRAVIREEKEVESDNDLDSLPSVSESQVVHLNAAAAAASNVACPTQAACQPLESQSGDAANLPPNILQACPPCHRPWRREPKATQAGTKSHLHVAQEKQGVSSDSSQNSERSRASRKERIRNPNQMVSEDLHLTSPHLVGDGLAPGEQGALSSQDAQQGAPADSHPEASSVAALLQQAAPQLAATPQGHCG